MHFEPKLSDAYSIYHQKPDEAAYIWAAKG